MTTCHLTVPGMAQIPDYIRANAKHARSMAEAGQGKGRSVSICGAGPSLAGMTVAPTSEVWACNSALPYLRDRGDRVTHGFCIDQGEAMLGAEEWQRTFKVEYLLASSVHPSLVAHLRRAGRSLRFFHSYLGIPDPEGWTGRESQEMHLYRTLYPTSVQVGYGLNSVPRAVCLALVMGYDAILVHGADCACAPADPMPPMDSTAYDAWLAELVVYAKARPWPFGRTIMAEGLVDGRTWVTRPDMVISALHLADLAERYPQVRLMGDTLPAALLRDPEARAEMPRIAGPGLLEHFAEYAG